MYKFLFYLSLSVAALMVVFSSEQLKDDGLNMKRPEITMLTNSVGNSGGTGFYVKAPSGKTYILTNGHVCGLAEDGLIVARNSLDTFQRVIAVYPLHDLCLVEAPLGAKGITVAASVRTGENIYVLGHPLLEPKTLTKGQMSGPVTINVMQGYNVPCEGVGFKKIPLDPNDLLSLIMGVKYTCIRSLTAETVTANILPGNSGSPVLNSFGNLVGVAFAGINGSGRGYIVPLSEVKKFLGDR